MNMHGYVHRDIKLENILYSSQKKQITLIDFGFAAKYAAGQIAAHPYMGTPAYMAPEIFTGAKTDIFKADVYSLGVVFYQMLCDGKLPFVQKGSRGNWIHRSSFSRHPETVQMPNKKNVRQEVYELIRSMLQIDPALRPSVEDILKMRPFSEWQEAARKRE